MGTRRRWGALRRLPSGRWQAKYRDPNTGQWVTAPHTYKLKTEAQKWLTVTEADVLRAVPANLEGERITVADWSERWLASKRGQRAATVARDRSALAYALPVIGTLALARVKPLHVRDVVDRMAGLAPATIQRNVNVLGAMFTAAVEYDIIATSPVRRGVLALPTVTRQERPLLTPSELLEVVGHLDGRYQALVLTAGVLGLRWGEAAGLRTGDIDFAGGTVQVRQTVEEVAGHVRVVAATKTASSRRTVTAPPFLLARLREHLTTWRPDTGPDDLCFVGPSGGILRRNFVARHLRPAAQRAGIRDGLTFHGLRHLATTYMVQTGEHPRVVQARLGHSDPRLSMGVYAHVPDALDRQAAQNLDRLFVDSAATAGT